ncbi:DUF6114 domain-containing protein [Nonomuraea sp. NPDC049400]|uniref:DUF6114 domain-containing protein n=1 Tax=Nonomuraea sp. NPDC049400 TaxID=3364352 RepID=UPI0037967B1B
MKQGRAGGPARWARLWGGFGRWRRARPFWGGALVLLAGVELIAVPWATSSLPVVVRAGSAGATYLLGLVLALLGVLLWAQPAHRVFYGLVATLLALASFVYSNLGGFGLGLLLGLVGGALGTAWRPVAASREPPPARRALAVVPVLLAVPLVPPSAGAVTVREPVVLTADRMTLTGARFDGVTRLRTRSGSRDMLRFTVDRAVLDAPRQTGGGVALRAARLTLGPHVVVYMRTLYGRPAGLAPVQLSADHPTLVTLALRTLPTLPRITLTQVVVGEPIVRAGTARLVAPDISAHP